jgi:hypothetical protein
MKGNIGDRVTGNRLTRPEQYRTVSIWCALYGTSAPQPGIGKELI